MPVIDYTSNSSQIDLIAEVIASIPGATQWLGLYLQQITQVVAVTVLAQANSGMQGVLELRA